MVVWAHSPCRTPRYMHLALSQPKAAPCHAADWACLVAPSQCPERYDFCSCCYMCQGFCLVLSSFVDIKFGLVCESASATGTLQIEHRLPQNGRSMGHCLLLAAACLNGCPLPLTSCFWHNADICTGLMEAYKRQCLLSQAQSQYSTEA